MKQTKIQVIEKQVEQANQLVKITDELDFGYKKLTGIGMLSNFSGLKGVIQQSSVSGSELLPKNFEAAFISSNAFVDPNKRFFTLHGFEAEGNKIELEYKDNDGAPAYPFTLRIYLRLEND